MYFSEHELCGFLLTKAMVEAKAPSMDTYFSRSTSNFYRSTSNFSRSTGRKDAFTKLDRRREPRPLPALVVGNRRLPTRNPLKRGHFFLQTPM